MIDASNSLPALARHRTAQGHRPPRAQLALWLVVLGLSSAACDATDAHPPPAPADGGEHLNARVLGYDSATADSHESEDDACTAGMTRECRIYLPAHDGIQPCFVGEQRCVENQWSLCDDVLLVDANRDDEAIDPGSSSGGYGP
ncbi:MAG: hypothetical protein ABI895_11595 [Deltaproteobacteria bacterium]